MKRYVFNPIVWKIGAADLAYVLSACKLTINEDVYKAFPLLANYFVEIPEPVAEVNSTDKENISPKIKKQKEKKLSAV